MKNKISGILIVVFFITSCGFKPTLKNIDSENNPLVYYEINRQNSYISRQVLLSSLQNIEKEKSKFIVEVQVLENEAPVNVNSSGSVIEYKIEIKVQYKIYRQKDYSLVYQSQTRGFSNYDVSNSEYKNTLVKEEALKRALESGIRLMNIAIQSKISE